MKKSIWLLAIAVLAISLLLAACGGGTPSATTPKPTSTTPSVTVPTPPSTTPAATTPKPTTPAVTTTTPKPTSTTTAATAPAIPASHGKPVDASRVQCLICHQTGIGGSKAVPADHAGRTNDQCQLCHKPA